jgi:multidrug efflux pump subunit AcrA (membrane-fusion protein)
LRIVAREKGATPDIVDERQNYYQVAVAAKKRAQAAVLKAKSDLREAQAKLEAVRADVDLKEALIKVAKADRDRAQAMLDLATIKAPYDGVITRRTVDPGSFVQNAATGGHLEPLLSVERTDIVTVHMKLPDTYAPYVTWNTEAIISMTELPGQLLHANVSRSNPSLQTPEHDRTMRVEVDLYNGTEAEYQRFLANEKATDYADLKGDPKLKASKLPLFPKVKGNLTQSHRLLPGMYGKMRLVLRKFKNAYLVPSEAIIKQGGTPYIYLVKGGKARLQQVEEQLNNGKLAKVVLVAKEDDQEVKLDLTGDEEIIISNQGELSDGQAVRATRVDN